MMPMFLRRGTPRSRAINLSLGTALGVSLICCSRAYADEAQPAPAANQSDLFSQSRTQLLGDAGGLRTLLAKYGITFTLFEESEVFGNVTGGVRRGAAYDGVTTPTVQVDTQKAFGWAGGLFQASALQIHGENLSTKNLLALQTVSGLEANRSTRLWELWYQQTLGNTGFDVKIGQQTLDQEFIVSSNALLFMNTMLGWPLLPSADLYGGGPAYPLSSLGVRVHGQLAPNLTGLLGVFDDNPPGGPFKDDSQTRGLEAYGVRFNLDTGALVIGELQYATKWTDIGDASKAPSKGLPGTYKIGFWYDTAAFPDQQFDINGVSLASPASNGIAAQRRGNFSVYGVFDQVLWQPDTSASRALSAFARVMAAPEDRNLISYSLNAGLTLKAPFQGRDNDTLGVAVGYGQVSNGAQAFDEARAAFASPGTLAPVRSSETFIEATYQIQLAGWWQLAPDFQYIFHPGGGIVNPLIPTQLIHDEAIFGMRTTIQF